MRAPHVQICSLALVVASVAVGTAARRGNVQAADLRKPRASEFRVAREGSGTLRPALQRLSRRGGRRWRGSGRGLAPPSNLADTTWDHGSTDGEIFTAIKSGIPPEFAMEPWGDRITDPDI